MKRTGIGYNIDAFCLFLFKKLRILHLTYKKWSDILSIDVSTPL